MGDRDQLLFELLSSLTYDEWQAAKSVVDQAFSAVADPLYQKLHTKLGTMTCEVTGAELQDGFTAWLGRSATCDSGTEPR